MIKILEHGNPEKPVVFKCLCCGCKFEATKEDYKIYDEQLETILEIDCPECNEHIVQAKKKEGMI